MKTDDGWKGTAVLFRALNVSWWLYSSAVLCSTVLRQPASRSMQGHTGSHRVAQASPTPHQELAQAAPFLPVFDWRAYIPLSHVYCIALHCVALCCIVLCCILLYCIVLCCIVLYQELAQAEPVPSVFYWRAYHPTHQPPSLTSFRFVQGLTAFRFFQEPTFTLSHAFAHDI